MSGPHRESAQLDAVGGAAFLPTLRRATFPGLLSVDAIALVALVGLATAHAWTGRSTALVAPLAMLAAGLLALLALAYRQRPYPKARVTVDEEGVLLSFESGGWSRTYWRDVCAARRVGPRLAILLVNEATILIEGADADLARAEATVRARAGAPRRRPGMWVLGVLLLQVLLGGAVLVTHQPPELPADRIAEAIERGREPEDDDLDVTLDGDVCERAAILHVLERAHRVTDYYFAESRQEDAETYAAAWLGTPCDPHELVSIGRVELQQPAGRVFEYRIFDRRSGGWLAVGPYGDWDGEPSVWTHEGSWSESVHLADVAADHTELTGVRVLDTPRFDPGQ